MNRQRIVTSAALYFPTSAETTVQLRWLEIARAFFKDCGADITYFDTRCVDFSADDAQDFPLHEVHLMRSLRRGAVEYLGLGAIVPGTSDVEDWSIRVSIDCGSGMLYVGTEEEIVFRPSELLRRAHVFAQVGIDVRYGISYKSTLAEAPELYAAGARLYSLRDVARELATEHERTLLDAWFEEMIGEKRHLKGFFRGAYPASAISDAHVSRTHLESLGVGALSQLDAGLWLWVLSDREIPTADRLLDKLGVLIK